MAGPALQPERDVERLALRIGETLADSRIGEHSCCSAAKSSSISPSTPQVADDAEILARLDGVLEQRGLADARIAVHHEDGAVTVAGAVQQPLEHGQLALPAEQPPRARRGHHGGSIPSGAGRAVALPRRGCTQRPCLAPVEDELAFGEVPAAVDLGECVEVAERGDHDLAVAVLGEDVVRDRVALAGRAVAVERDGALPVEVRRGLVAVRSSKTGVSASRPSRT